MLISNEEGAWILYKIFKESLILYIFGVGNEMNRALGHLCAHIG